MKPTGPCGHCGQTIVLGPGLHPCAWCGWVTVKEWPQMEKSISDRDFLAPLLDEEK